MKYPPEKRLYPQNSHEKKFQTHEIPGRKNLGHTRYPQQKNFDQQNTRKGMITR